MKNIMNTGEDRQWLSAQRAESQGTLFKPCHNIKIFFSLLLICCIVNTCIIGVDAVEPDAGANETEKIIGIESSSFFDALKKDYQEVFYVYFGRPTCLECIEFEKELRTFLETSNWVVYYYDTAYWKDDPRYDSILSKYCVESVPMLVKICFGEYESSFAYDPSADSLETQEQLNRFFPALPDGILSVTDKSFPIQFHDRLSFFVALLLFVNAVYLFAVKKELIRKKPKFTILFIFITSSIMAWLQVYIFSLGFSFTMAYEAEPAKDLLSQFGKLGLAISGPLYLAICCLCIYIKGKQSEGNNLDTK